MDHLTNTVCFCRHDGGPNRADTNGELAKELLQCPRSGVAGSWVMGHGSWLWHNRLSLPPTIPTDISGDFLHPSFELICSTGSLRKQWNRLNSDSRRLALALIVRIGCSFAPTWHVNHAGGLRLNARYPMKEDLVLSAGGNRGNASSALNAPVRSAERQRT